MDEIKIKIIDLTSTYEEKVIYLNCKMERFENWRKNCHPLNMYYSFVLDNEVIFEVMKSSDHLALISYFIGFQGGIFFSTREIFDRIRGQ